MYVSSSMVLYPLLPVISSDRRNLGVITGGNVAQAVHISCMTRGVRPHIGRNGEVLADSCFVERGVTPFNLAHQIFVVILSNFLDYFRFSFS